jgi:hypothetical protein
VSLQRIELQSRLWAANETSFFLVVDWLFGDDDNDDDDDYVLFKGHSKCNAIYLCSNVACLKKNSTVFFQQAIFECKSIIF